MMANKKLLYGILAIVIAVVGIGLFVYLSKPTVAPSIGQFGEAGMLTGECADKSYITETADHIIEVTIEKVGSKWNEERTSISTYTDLKIEKYVKGAPFSEDKLQIETLGGEVGDIGLGVEDQPIFHEGAKVRIYLQETNGGFSIVCGEMGVEKIGQQTTPSTTTTPTSKEFCCRRFNENTGKSEFFWHEDSNCGTPEGVFCPGSCPSVTDKNFCRQKQETATTPTSKESCESSGGIWKVWRDVPNAQPECNSPTPDSGRLCTDSSQCESYCEAPKGSEIDAKAEGKCHGFKIAVCMQEVKNGIAAAEWCN